MTKNKISQEDSIEFRNSVKNVKPLSPTQQQPIIQRQKKKPLKAITKKTFLPSLMEDATVPTVAAEEKINFSHGGLQHKVLRQFRQGQIPIEAELDLHGKNSTQAAIALEKFIEHCQKKQLRCVRIIHGKGHNSEQPILKNKVNNWLRQLPAVLAFHSAKPVDGGAGALYVLLRKK